MFLLEQIELEADQHWRLIVQESVRRTVIRRELGLRHALSDRAQNTGRSPNLLAQQQKKRRSYETSYTTYFIDRRAGYVLGSLLGRIGAQRTGRHYNGERDTFDGCTC